MTDIKLTKNELRMIELGRELKNRRGHGTLRVEYKNGCESLFEPILREIPPEQTEKILTR